jgi:RNA polymerase sigma factor (sigma-70 family)
MTVNHTTIAVQRYLEELAEASSAEPLVRALLNRSVSRLHQICAHLLYRRYPRLTRPPMNLVADELLSAVVERLLKAMREARPKTARHFFALACQHIRWELNDMARRLDEQQPMVELKDDMAMAAQSSVSGLTADTHRILSAIENLPPDEREAFDLVRIQGLSQADAAHVLGVSTMTVNRRLHRGLRQLVSVLGDLYPAGAAGGDALGAIKMTASSSFWKNCLSLIPHRSKSAPILPSSCQRCARCGGKCAGSTRS